MKKVIGIIGGKGIMGKFFADVFKKQGFRVLISDIHTKLTNKELVKRSDIVFFSVPIDKTKTIIKNILPYTRKNQILCDFTSLKGMPIKEMMKSGAEVIGFHPMFRPLQTGLKNQTVVMCPARTSKKTKEFLKDLFIKEEAEIIEMSPKKHDHLMSIIQVLFHFKTIVLGNTLEKLKIPINETLKIASPIYKLEMNMIGRTFSQDADLYGGIAALNPESKKVIKKVLEESQKLATIIQKKDLKTFKKTFRKTAQFLGPFKEKALEETNTLLSYISKNLTK